MKKEIISASLILLVMFLFFLSACVTDPLETCEEDEICEGKTVQACCTDTRCYYLYNGIEYGDDAASLERLAAALGCAKAGSVTYNKDMEDLILRLEALSDIARTQTVK